jgi:hypothetical protein
MRTTKYECNCCRETMTKPNGTALRFGNGSPKKTIDWDECSVHICPVCTKSLQQEPLHAVDRMELEKAKAVKQSLIRLLGIPESSSWEPIYEFVRDQAKRYHNPSPQVSDATTESAKGE